MGDKTGERRVFVYWFALYTALAIAVTFPLVLRLSSTVADGPGDALMSASFLWWNAHVLPLTTRWWNGFAFFPASGTTAFSDHRLGESLLATPLQWAGCSTATAYNLTFLATFPLCAIAAHALGFTLTRRHDAGAIAGLAYGFNPYRIAHLAHLELLASFGMPIALAALHLALTTRRLKWLVVFTAALIVQGLCTSYYIAFFSVLMLLWVLWFVRWADVWLLPWLAAACAVLAATLLPLAIAFSHIHTTYGMFRSLVEVMEYSADVTSLVTATGHSALWGWTSGLNRGEGQIFPGLWVVVLVLCGAIVAIRGRPLVRDRRNWWALGFGALAATYAVVAYCAKVFGPWRVVLGPLVIGADVFFKPLTVSVAAAALALAASTRGRDAWAFRSPLAFYGAATVVMFVCSFGPRPTFLGQQVLYEPPYAWLMRLPIFSTEIRAPARFAMLATLTLSAAGALALDRFRVRRSTRRLVAVFFMVGILADGAIHGMRMPDLPEPFSQDRVAGFDAVVELPLGDDDYSAMYRATLHGRPVVNGASGYSPANYDALAAAIRETDATVLDALPGSRLLVAVNDQTDPHGFWRATLGRRNGATHLADERGWSFFSFASPPATAVCQAPLLPIAGVSGRDGDIDVRLFSDGDPKTAWWRPTQSVGDALLLDLGQPANPCALLMSIGSASFAFPRRLSIATSVDGAEWRTVFDGSTAAQTVLAAIERPKDAWLPFSLPADSTRFIRIRLESSQLKVPWQVTDIVVRGAIERSREATPQ